MEINKDFLTWQWYTCTNTKSLFLHMLIITNTKDVYQNGIKVQKGQFISNIAKLSSETGLSTQNIRTSIKKLVSCGELTKSKVGKQMLFCVKNYFIYSNNDELTILKQKTNDITMSIEQYQNIVSSYNQQLSNDELTTLKQKTNDITVKSKKNNTNSRRKNNQKNKKNIPTYVEFSDYAIMKTPYVDIEKLRLKYDSWKVNGWKDGNDRSISNWKSKLLNTLPYLQKQDDKKNKIIKF